MHQYQVVYIKEFVLRMERVKLRRKKQCHDGKEETVHETLSNVSWCFSRSICGRGI